MNLSPFPLHFLILSPFPLHFLILSSYSRSQAARLPQFVQPCIDTHKKGSTTLVLNTLKALSKLEQMQLNCTPDLAPYHILQLIFRDIYSHMITPHFLTIANYCRPVLKLPLSVCFTPILRNMVPSTSTSTNSDKGKLLSWRKTTFLQHNLFVTNLPNFLTVILELQVTPTLPAIRDCKGGHTLIHP